MLESRDASGLTGALSLEFDTVSKLAGIALQNIYTVYPNKLNQVLCSADDLKPPQELHPTFYGCFDWHSSVHSHWLLAKVAHLFPDSELSKKITTEFSKQFTKQKIQKELQYFETSEGQSFERTYGWAWLLKLQSELQFSEIEDMRDFSVILRPLADKIVDLYMSFLPRLVYPVRAGEHANTAFGLVFALEYARLDGNKLLEDSINTAARKFFLQDRECPLNYEPSGYDFLSPALQEADLMSRIIEDRVEYTIWLENFLPKLFCPRGFNLEPAEVLDRSDGKLVHLDGLNFSRAWNLYSIAAKTKHPDNIALTAILVKSGDNHILQSIGNVVGSDYAGSHWLASFLLHALDVRHQLNKLHYV